MSSKVKEQPDKVLRSHIRYSVKWLKHYFSTVGSHPLTAHEINLVCNNQN